MQAQRATLIFAIRGAKSKISETCTQIQIRGVRDQILSASGPRVRLLSTSSGTTQRAGIRDHPSQQNTAAAFGDDRQRKFFSFEQ